MTTTTATTSTATDITMSAAPYTSAEPQYQHVGGQRFVPANAAAWREVERFNEWADRVNARTAASRSAAQ